MRKYFTRSGSETLGPFKPEDLFRQSITKETLIWFDGIDNWTPAGSIPELNSVFDGVTFLGTSHTVQNNKSFSSTMILAISGLIIIIGAVGYFAYNHYYVGTDSANAKPQTNSTKENKVESQNENKSRPSDHNNETANQNTTPTVSATTTQNLGKYRCKKNRVYFYNSPNYNSKSGNYLVANDIILIESISNDNNFGYGVYVYRGQQTKGWLDFGDIEYNANQGNASYFPGKYPQGSQRKLADGDVQGLSQRELLIMKNEIYARNGYQFNLVPWVIEYFNEQSWYVNSPHDKTDATQVYNQMTDDEKYNIEFLGRYIH